LLRNINLQVDQEHRKRICSSLQSPAQQALKNQWLVGIPKSAIQNVIYMRLHLYAYKIHLKHEIKPDDWPKCYDFASLMLNKIDDVEISLRQICFSEEQKFHMNGYNQTKFTSMFVVRQEL
jgi:hypothetical protein